MFKGTIKELRKDCANKGILSKTSVNIAYVDFDKNTSYIWLKDYDYKHGHYMFTAFNANATLQDLTDTLNTFNCHMITNSYFY